MSGRATLSRSEPLGTKLAAIARRYDTDKAEHFHYLRNYEENFSERVDKEITLLELGVKSGGSLLLWRDYFPKGRIIGLDINPIHINDPTGRITTYEGKQQDTRFLDHIAQEVAPEGFDIIIDDCSHIGVLSRTSFWHLFDNHLKSGGLYIVEDWGTGYWDNWLDGVKYKEGKKSFNQTLYKMLRGVARLQQVSALNRMPLLGTLLRGIKRTLIRSEYRTHDYGMVGFVKELVDELGITDATKPTTDTAAALPSKFREMRIYRSHLFVTKA
jgi:hypothetical protein